MKTRKEGLSSHPRQTAILLFHQIIHALTMPRGSTHATARPGTCSKGYIGTRSLTVRLTFVKGKFLVDLRLIEGGGRVATCERGQRAAILLFHKASRPSRSLTRCLSAIWMLSLRTRIYVAPAELAGRYLLFLQP